MHLRLNTFEYFCLKFALDLEYAKQKAYLKVILGDLKEVILHQVIEALKVMQLGIKLDAEQYPLNCMLFLLVNEQVCKTDKSEGTCSQHESTSP